jgi:hypothetical protein
MSAQNPQRMNWKGALTTALSLFAAIALAIWLAAEHESYRKANDEYQALQAKFARITQPAAPKETAPVTQPGSSEALTAAESLELLRLRGEIGLLCPQVANLESIRNENHQARAALDGTLKDPAAATASAAATADYWPHDSWAFKGYTSPEAALQTILWAANNGDVKTLAASTHADIQKMIQGDLEGKKQDEASIKVMDEVFNLKSVHVLNREFKDPDTAIITAEFEGRDETTTETLLLKKVGDEWKLAARHDSSSPPNDGAVKEQ